MNNKTLLINLLFFLLFSCDKIDYYNEVAKSLKNKNINQIRSFVFNNTLHKIDSEHAKYAFDKNEVIKRIYNVMKDKGNKPHLSCGPRAIALSGILNSLKYKTRIVSIFSDNFDSIQSHTFIEVFINNKWVIQDPDFNIFYKNIDTKQMLSIDEVVFGDIRKIIPCNEKACGWEINKVEHLKKNYFEAYMIHNQKIVYNSKRFNKLKYFKKNETTFQKFAEKKYNVDISIER